jgi:hypothetical protein
MTLRRCTILAGITALIAYTIGNTMLLRSIEHR